MIIALDTETTEFAKKPKEFANRTNNWPNLVQLSWIEYSNSGDWLTEYDFIIKPSGFNISARSASIHGITNKIANERGLPLLNVLNIFKKRVQEAKLLVAHNMNFDFNVLVAESKRNYFQAGKLYTVNRFCTMQKSRDILKLPGNGKAKYKNPSLKELYYHFFKKEIENQHYALNDARACGEAFFKLLPFCSNQVQ